MAGMDLQPHGRKPVKYPANEGVIVSGHGNISAENMAVGRGAAIHQHQGAGSDALTDVQRKLDALLIELDKQKGAIENGDEVRQSAKMMQEELAKPTPNRLTLKSVLSGITESVKSVSTLATAAEALKGAFTVLFG